MARNLFLRILLVGALSAAMFAVTNPSQAADPVIVANPTFATNTANWTNTSNATLTRVVDAGQTAGKIQPISSSSIKTIGMTSSPSDTIAGLGTDVHVAGQVLSTRIGQPVAFQLRELDTDGSVLQRFDGVVTPNSTTAWYWTEATITTLRANARVNLYVHQVGVTGTRYLKVRAISADLTPPTTPLACADIDYSQSDQGHLVFGDEFNGSAVDTTKWGVRDGQSLSFDKARILARNVTVHDGLLDISGKRETVSGRDYTTGYIDTIGKFSQKYGTWVMRAKVPTDGTQTRGVWPAFWLRGDTTPGEIDIMETWGAPATQSYNPSISNAWTIWRDTHVGGADKFTGWSLPQSHTPSIWAAYHEFALTWSAECMTFSFDGNVVASVDTDAAAWMVTSFDSPFNIRLNMQIGSSYWGNPDSTNTKPQFNYLVDYVRAYAAD